MVFDMSGIEEYFHHCMYFTVSRLSRVVTRMAEEEFLITGLSPTYAFLLMLVKDRPGISQKELCEKLHIAQSTVTRFIDKLESKKLVSRTVRGKNSFITLTSRGDVLQKDIAKAWKNFFCRYLKILGEKEAARLTELTDMAGDKLEKGSSE